MQRGIPLPDSFYKGSIAADAEEELESGYVADVSGSTEDSPNEPSLTLQSDDSVWTEEHSDDR